MRQEDIIEISRAAVGERRTAMLARSREHVALTHCLKGVAAALAALAGVGVR
jgi:hypothetical protein